MDAQREGEGLDRAGGPEQDRDGEAADGAVAHPQQAVNHQGTDRDEQAADRERIETWHGDCQEPAPLPAPQAGGRPGRAARPRSLPPLGQPGQPPHQRRDERRVHGEHQPARQGGVLEQPPAPQRAEREAHRSSERAHPAGHAGRLAGRQVVQDRRRRAGEGPQAEALQQVGGRDLPHRARGHVHEVAEQRQHAGPEQRAPPPPQVGRRAHDQQPENNTYDEDREQG